MTKTQKLAYRIANDLFTSGGGSGRRAVRLVLENSDGSNGGGWCFKAAVARIETHLRNTKKP